jgi:FtsH-binding integral membrane protein
MGALDPGLSWLHRLCTGFTNRKFPQEKRSRSPMAQFQLDPVDSQDPLLASAASSWERIAYLQKVYSLVLLGIAVFAFTLFGVAQDLMGLRGLASGLMGMSPILLIVLMLGSAYGVRVIARKPGIGLVGYLAYAVFLALLMSSLVLRAGITGTLLPAAITTLGVFLGLTTYVFVTKKDFSWMGGILFTVLFGMIAVGICAMLFGFQLGLIWNLLGALLFSGFILYDTSNVMNTNRTDQPLPAAIELFVDVVMLFWYILALFNND